MFVEWSGNRVTIRHDNRNYHRTIFARGEVQCAQINGDHVAVTLKDNGHTALYDARTGNLVRQ